MFIIKLKNTLAYKQLINNYLLIALSVILLLLFINYWYCGFIYIIYLYYIYKKGIKKLFIIIIIIDAVILCLYIIFILLYYDQSINEISGIITKIQYKDGYNKIIIKKGIYKYLVYDFDPQLSEEYTIGNFVNVKGINLSIDKANLNMMFDNYNYLISNKIVSIIQKESLTVENRFNIYSIKSYIFKYVNNNFSLSERSFIYALVLGDTSLIDEEINESIKINGISHLFAISGLHISILINIFNKILFNVKKRKYYINIFLGIYMFITNFSPSIVRCVFMTYLKDINDKYNLNLTSLDIISIVFIVLIIINPYYMYMIGFILSFFVSFIFIITSKHISKYSSFKQSVLLSVISFIGTMPLIVNLNNSVNILSIISNIIFIYLTTVIILPASLISFICPFLLTIYKIIIDVFIKLNDLFANKIVLNITLPNFHILETLLFYILIYIGFIIYKNKEYQKYIKKYVIICILFIFVYYNKANLNIIPSVEFLDLKDGEAILINQCFNKSNILIDTGDGTNNAVSSYLKKLGIRKIDYLIITHGHDDHNGEMEKIINEITVKNIIVSAYYNSVLPVNGVNIIYVKKGDIINIDDLVLEVLSPVKESKEENDNSLVIGTKLGNYKYLFLGDATNDILDNIYYDADIIKAGHHGSKTSASYQMYSNIMPEYVIMQTGRTFKYNFPDNETVSLLNSLNIKYYQTNVHSTITIYYTNIGSIIKTLW